MKGFRQSRMLKAVAVVLLFFSIIAIPLSAVGELYLSQEVFDGDWGEMFGGSFKDSDRFSKLFGTRIGQLAEYIELKDILETDGKLDYDKAVGHMAASGVYPDIMQDEEIGFADAEDYTIGELIKRNSFFVEDVDSQNAARLEELFNTYYSQEYCYVCTDENGETVLGSGYGEKYIKNFSRDEDWYLVENREDALDIQRERVWNDKTENKVWVFTVDELSYRYTYYVAYYLYYQSLFENDREHRFVYFLVSKEKARKEKAYANTDNIDDYMSGSLPADGTLFYSSRGYTVDTSVPNLERFYVDDLEKAILENSQQFEFWAAVVPLADSGDTEEDAFTIKENYFNRAQGLCHILLVIGIAGAFGVLILGLYLTASAGHEKNVEGVHLTWFDKWYTEIGAVACISVMVCAGLLEAELIEEAVWMWKNFGYHLMAAGGALVCYLAGLFSIASFLRRIKAGTLWKNSLLRKGGRWLVSAVRRAERGCRVVYEERDITTRVIIAYIMILAATVVTGLLLMVTLFEGSVLVLFFLFLFTGIHAGSLYMLLRDRMDYKRIIEGMERMADGDLNYKVDEAGLQPDNKRLAVATNRVGNGLAAAVQKSIKDERMKTDLITNVSHDIKTPLTSIINYVDLLKREKIEDEKIRSYIEVLDSKSQRLKNLTDDLVEASKLSSGNIVLTMQEINLVELVNQANGEFTEKFAQKNLTIVAALPDTPIKIEADGRRLWRVLENLYNNVSKYGMAHTRVYVTVAPEDERVSFVMKNISENSLNINADELTERFIRGDVSRSTEGSGLGLSIARSLTELMKGSFEIYLDGDLFRVTVTFPRI